MSRTSRILNPRITTLVLTSNTKSTNIIILTFNQWRTELSDKGYNCTPSLKNKKEKKKIKIKTREKKERERPFQKERKQAAKPHAKQQTRELLLASSLLASPARRPAVNPRRRRTSGAPVPASPVPPATAVTPYIYEP